MIIFARAPGTTGWVEIKPEEELSHLGQFWEIRKFAVEQEDAMPLARRLDRAEQALRAAGFLYHGPSEKWVPSKTFVRPAQSPDPREKAVRPFSFNWDGATDAEALSDAYRALQNTLLVVPDSRFKRGMDDWLSQRLGVTDGEALSVPDPAQPMALQAVIPENELLALLPCGNDYSDEPDGGSVTVLEQVKRMGVFAKRYRVVRHSPYLFGMAGYSPTQVDQSVDDLISIDATRTVGGAA